MKRARASGRSGRSSKRAKRTRRMVRIKRTYGSCKNQITLSRTSYAGNWGFNTATTNGFWRYVQFDMNAFNNFGEFTVLFDEYKVNAIKVTYRPRFDSVTASEIPANLPGVQESLTIHTLVDPASTVIPSGTYTSGTLNQFLENSGVRSRSGLKPFSIYFKPKAQVALLGGGTGTKLVSPGWIKTTEPNVGFRGFHMFVQTMNMAVTTSNQILDQYVTFYVSFRNLK